MKKNFGDFLSLLTDFITGWIWVPYAVLWVVSFVLAIINGSQTEESCMTVIVAFLVVINFFYFFFSSLQENYLMGGILRCIWFALPSVLAIMDLTDSLTPVWNVIIHWVYLLYVLENIALSIIRVGMGEDFRTKAFGFISIPVQFLAYIICFLNYHDACPVQGGFLPYLVSFLLLLVSLSTSIMMFKMIWMSGYDEKPSDAWYKKLGRGTGRVLKTVFQAIWTLLVVAALYMTMGLSFDFGRYVWVAFAALLALATVVLTVMFREYVCDAIVFVADFSLWDILTDWEMTLNPAAYQSTGSSAARPSNTQGHKNTATDKDDWSKPVDKRKTDTFGHSLFYMLDRRFTGWSSSYASSASCKVSVGPEFFGLKITVNGTCESTVGYSDEILVDEIFSEVESVLDDYMESYRGNTIFNVYVNIKVYDFVTNEYLGTVADSTKFSYTS
ncbi:MAG: hypothetical protein IJD38_01380 [Clostridia bacterium]|nr:hypothetical protein [Clostridia bacterium]